MGGVPRYIESYSFPRKASSPCIRDYRGDAGKWCLAVLGFWVQGLASQGLRGLQWDRVFHVPKCPEELTGSLRV